MTMDGCNIHNIT